MAKRRYLHRPKYHLTPIDHITSIKRLGGLRAGFDARGHGRVWMCDEDQIANIAYHLLDVKGLNHCHFAVYEILWWQLPTHLRRHSRDGVYWVNTDVNIRYIRLVKRFIADRRGTAFPRGIQ